MLQGLGLRGDKEEVLRFSQLVKLFIDIIEIRFVFRNCENRDMRVYSEVQIVQWRNNGVLI